MIREQYTNAVETTLNGSINNTTTTVVLTDASTFPTAGFRIKIENEIMYVSSRSSNTLTVVRGQEGTTAASHAGGLPANHVLTKGALDRFRIGILGDCGLVPYEDPLSADDDDFDDESFSGWTTVQGSPNVTVTERNHRASVLLPGGSGSAQQYGFVKAKSPSAGGWVQAGFQMMTSGGNGYPLPGVVISDGNTYGAGKQVVWGWSPREGLYILRDFTNWNSSGSTSSYSDVYGFEPSGTLHMRLVWQGSNSFDGYISGDGISWITVFTGQSQGSLGTPTHMGFCTTSWGASRALQTSFTYCRFSF